MPKRHMVASGCFFEPEEEVVPNPIVGRKKGSVDFDDTLYRTALGGFINHAEQSNCVRVKVNNKWYLKTTKDIMPEEELTLTYSLYKPE